MFQRLNRDRLLMNVVLNSLFAVGIVLLPTVVLLGIIGGRIVQVENGAVTVDVPLGTILVFSSLAAIVTPFVYRPVNVLAATTLAKSWIAASARSSYNAPAFLPSTPQYLLAVGNLGTPGILSLWKSVQYYSRKSTRVSPVLTHSTICLAALLFTALMVTVGDVWIHVTSTTVPETTILTTSGLGNFSLGFAAPENSSTAPWRLQQGLRTFLDVSSLSTVVKLNETSVIVPVDIPSDRTVVGSTIGMELECNLINADCLFDQISNPPTFDCSNVQPGAIGPLGAVNVTFYDTNSTSINIIASMALPSVFNTSVTIVPSQVFQCLGSLDNVTYSSVNGQFNIVRSEAIDNSPLTELWNLNEFAGKQSLIESALAIVGTSTIVVQGINTTTIPSVFANGLSRLFMSFLSGETIPTQSLQESPASDRLLSRIPLAPIIFLATIIILSAIAISILALRAMLTLTNLPQLDGNPISIINLHKQLVSPIDVLAATIGDTPLAMKIQFNGSDEGRVQFDLPPGSTSDNESLKRRVSEVSVPQERDEMSVEEARVFLGMQARREEQEMRREEEGRTISPEPTTSPRYSWSDAEFIPVYIDYDDTDNGT